MNRRILFGFLSLVLIVLLIPDFGSGVAFAQSNVTFRVNMSIKMREGGFDKNADIVTVRGAFNDWGNSTGNPDTLKDLDGDSVYTLTKSLAAGAYDYKFWKSLRNGVDYEGVPNRNVAVSADTSLPIWYFDDDSVYTPPVPQNVTFAVNMRVKLAEGSFKPGSGDYVTVRGSFNGWGDSNGNPDTLKDLDGDSVYTKVISLLENQSIQYKFWKTLRAGSSYEGVSNRAFVVPVGGGSPSTPYFDDDTVIDPLVSGTVLWSVDMSAFETLGWFSRARGDSMEARGSFNGWSGSKMDRVPGTEVYEVTSPFDSPPNSDFSYKFFMDWDTTGAEGRFPGYNADRDGFQYEHPTERGDGNRLYNIGSGGPQQPATYWFGSINAGGLLDASDTVTVTFRVDMRPAMAYVDAFVRSTDSAWVVWNDKPSKAKQGNPPDIKLLDADNDSIYTGTLTIKGPAHYNLLYYVKFSHFGGPTGTVTEGAGLGAQNGYRSRYITPLSANTFPRNFTLPVDVWQKDPPYPADTPPLVTGVGNEDNSGLPGKFSLAQNYPNPFNPTTSIRYYLPDRVTVSLKVYNLLGQEVATIFNGEQVAGEHLVTFDASRLSTGIYFYSLHAGTFKEVRKMVLLK